jgi:hypothetical protein
MEFLWNPHSNFSPNDSREGICSRGEDDKRKASGFVYRLSADFSP